MGLRVAAGFAWIVSKKQEKNVLPGNIKWEIYAGLSMVLFAMALITRRGKRKWLIAVSAKFLDPISLFCESP